MPILNRAGISQVSPSATAAVVDQAPPGALANRFGRPGSEPSAGWFPNDNVQAAAPALFMDRESVNEVFVVDDGDTYGEGPCFRFEKVAWHTGIEITGGATVTRSIQIGDVAKRVIGSGADALLFAGSNLDLGPDPSRRCTAGQPSSLLGVTVSLLLLPRIAR